MVNVRWPAPIPYFSRCQRGTIRLSLLLVRGDTQNIHLPCASISVTRRKEHPRPFTHSALHPRSSNIYLPSLIKTMKIILTGSTGFIGQEILLQCLSHPQITSLIILSRRALPVSDPKLKVVLLEDFTRMPEEVLGELKGCDGCIWFVLPYILHSLNKFNI